MTSPPATVRRLGLGRLPGTGSWRAAETAAAPPALAKLPPVGAGGRPSLERNRGDG